MDIVRTIKLTVALAAMAAIVGCSGGGDKPAASGGPKEGVVWKDSAFKIVMIAKADNNPVFPTARKGAEQAAKDYSEKTGVNIQIDWRTPPDEDAQQQAARLQQAVSGGANAALMSLSEAEKVTKAIDDAVDAGVPVMTFDSDAPASKRFAFYGVDDEESGAEVMKELAKLTNGKANVAILAGNQTAPNLQKRVKGVKDEAAKYPGIKIVDTFYHKETPQDATKAVQSAMQANPQINAWAMIGGWPLFATSLLELDPKKVTIVAVDCLPAQLPYIEKGVAPVLLAQPTYQWGYVGVETIVNKFIYGKDVPVINKMKLVRVSKENLNEWAKQLKDWGFDDVDPKYLK